MPKGRPLAPKVPLNLEDPFTVRSILEMPICRASLFVRTELVKNGEGYVDGTELWEAYRLWAHRTPMSESAFLAALEKAKFYIYADGSEWLLQGWQWPNTMMPETGKKIGAEKTASRTYIFNKETLTVKRLKELAYTHNSFDGIAESLGWPAKKFAMYRDSFPRVGMIIEMVWAEHLDRFKPDATLPKVDHVARIKEMQYRAMKSALAVRNAKRKAAKAGRK